MSNNIVLIGLPACGKSTIGKILAEELGYDFIDTDLLIEKISKTSIPDIFEKQGEDAFRNIETNTINTLLYESNNVIAIGGGAYERSENRDLLRKIGSTFYLLTPIDILLNRLKEDDNSRPLFKNSDIFAKLQELQAKRHPNFLLADYVIDTNNCSIENVINNIKRIINGKNS